jgi:hypothetical protein
MKLHQVTCIKPPRRQWRVGFIWSPTPNEETAKAYIGKLPPSLADYAYAYWVHLLTGTQQPDLGRVLINRDW